MGKHRVPRSPEQCRAISERQRRRFAGDSELAASFSAMGAARSRVTFDQDMVSLAISGYWSGRCAIALAEEIGVHESTLRNYWRSQGLGSRRRIPGFYRLPRAGRLQRACSPPPPRPPLG